MIAYYGNEKVINIIKYGGDRKTGSRSHIGNLKDNRGDNQYKEVGNTLLPTLNSINVSKIEKEFYKAEDLAKLLDVNIMTIYRYIKAGKIEAYKIGKEFRIGKKEFERFLKKVRTK